MTHSWLITGPPGSGRSNLAYAFATALLSPGTAEGDEPTRRQVAARTHPDLGVLATENVIIKMEDVKKIVASSQFSPSVSRYRVMVIEDADRMQRAHLERAAEGARGAAAAHRLDPLRAERGRPDPHHPLPGAHRAAAGPVGHRSRRAAGAPDGRRP